MNTEITNTDTNSAAPAKEKRTRTSPRTKALDEVVAMLAAMLGDLTEEQKENGESAELAAKLELVTDISGRVTTMANEGAQKPDYAGRHYIGVTATGERVAFNNNVPPTKRSHGPETKHNFTTVYGPFRTTEGVQYRLDNPDTLVQHAPLF